MKSKTLYITTVAVVTLVCTILPPLAGSSELGLFLTFPFAIPLMALPFMENLDSLIAAYSIIILLFALLNAAIYLPILLYPKFRKRSHFIVTQLLVLVVYILISIPCFRTFGKWMSV